MQGNILYADFERKNSFVKDFISNYKQETTRGTYTKALRYFFDVKNINEITLNMVLSITPKRIKDYIKECFNVKKHTPSTVKSRFYALSSFYDDLISEDIYKKQNPFKNQGVKKVLSLQCPRNEEQKGKALTKEMVEKVLSQVDNDRDYLLLKLLFVTGCRRSEMLKIKWNDFKYDKELDKWFLIIRNDVGKGQKYREISISNDVIDLLKNYSGWGAGELEVDDYEIFKMSASTLYNVVRKYSKKAGVKISPHDTRRTTLTRLIDVGVPLNKVQGFSGHAQISTLMDLYYKPIENRRDNAGDYLDL